MGPALSLDGWCPYCPHQGYTSYSFTTAIRTCNRCGFTYYFEESKMPVCSVCHQGYTSCACPPVTKLPKLPKVGQIIKITQKHKGGYTLTFEGPVLGINTDMLIPISFLVGMGKDYRLVHIRQAGDMTENAQWEIVLPPEPPNKSVWVCPAGDNGKLSIWRRLDHLVGATGGKWFYPGSVNGATWEQVYNTGAGYLLDPNAVKNG